MISAWLVLAIAATGDADRAPTPAARAPDAREARIDAIEPVRVARAWTTALAPNARGGWNFITQTYEHESGAPTEWVVLDLATGQQHVTEGPPGVYANSNYQIAEQLRAANGRIFFPEQGDQMAYYDPADETVKQVGRLPGGPGDPLVFRVVFGPDGKLYGGTQSQGLPTVFRLDPDTLRYEVLGKVGRSRSTYSYAYYLAVDPPWLYAAVGESPWELAALDMASGEQRILATRAADGFLEFTVRPEGLLVKLISGLRTPHQTVDLTWCSDGALFAYEPGRPPPFRPHAVAPHDNPVRGAPEVDRSEIDPSADPGADPSGHGVGHVRWRPGPGAAWRDASFHVQHTSPVAIDSLVALPDGTLLGSAAQYHGFFRYDPRDRSVRRYRSLGISGGPRAVLDGVIYFSGYPNGVLYAYDPSRPWTATKEPRPDANPRYLGNFAAAGAHYAYFLEPVHGRLYYVGRRERDGVGGGIGYYDVTTRQFVGHHTGLDTLDPRGFAALDGGKTLVYSGRTNNGTPAQLVVFDPDLHERARQTVIPGMRDTGQLFTTAAPGVIAGVSATDHVIYRHDVTTGRLLGRRSLPGAVVAAAQRPADRSIWIAIDERSEALGGGGSAGVAGGGARRGIHAALWCYDPATLDGKRVRDLPGPPAGAGLLTWQGRRLFWAAGSRLREVTPGG